MFYIENNTFNKGVLLKGVLIPELDNKPDSSFLLINLDFLLLHSEQVDFSINLQLFVLKTFGFLLSVSFLHTIQ